MVVLQLTHLPFIYVTVRQVWREHSSVLLVLDATLTAARCFPLFTLATWQAWHFGQALRKATTGLAEGCVLAHHQPCTRVSKCNWLFDVFRPSAVLSLAVTIGYATILPGVSRNQSSCLGLCLYCGCGGS